MTGSTAWVEIARTGRTRGLRGELYAKSWNPPEQLLGYGSASFRRSDGSLIDDGREFRLLEARPYKDGLVLRIEGVESIEAAERFEHCDLVIRPERRPALGEGEYYLADLVGCAVIDRKSGRPIGTVAGWQEFGGPELLEVIPDGRGPEAVIWIPLVRTICVEIDPAGRRIVIDPPEGLLDLNE